MAGRGCQNCAAKHDGRCKHPPRQCRVCDVQGHIERYCPERGRRTLPKPRHEAHPGTWEWCEEVGLNKKPLIKGQILDLLKKTPGATIFLGEKCIFRGIEAHFDIQNLPPGGEVSSPKEPEGRSLEDRITRPLETRITRRRSRSPSRARHHHRNRARNGRRSRTPLTQYRNGTSRSPSADNSRPQGMNPNSRVNPDLMMRGRPGIRSIPQPNNALIGVRAASQVQPDIDAGLRNNSRIGGATSSAIKVVATRDAATSAARNASFAPAVHTEPGKSSHVAFPAYSGIINPFHPGRGAARNTSKGTMPKIDLMRNENVLAPPAPYNPFHPGQGTAKNTPKGTRPKIDLMGNENVLALPAPYVGDPHFVLQIPRGAGRAEIDDALDQLIREIEAEKAAAPGMALTDGRWNESIRVLKQAHKQLTRE